MTKNLLWNGAFLCAMSVLPLLAIACKSSEAPAPSRPSGPVGPGTTTNENVYVEPLVPTASLDKALPAMLAADTGAKFGAEKTPFPPVADLEGQLESYIKKLDRSLEDLESSKNFKADSEALIRDANALALIALALGLAEEESKFKQAAPAMIKAATAVEEAGDFAAAKAAVEAVKQGMHDKGDPSTLAWTKVAKLGPVMKAVPNISANVTRNGNTENKVTGRGKTHVLEGTAAMAVLVQGSMANYDETDKAGSKEEWERLCREFRDLAIKANAEAHKVIDKTGVYADFMSAFDAMKVSCDNCHKVFHQAAIGK